MSQILNKDFNSPLALNPEHYGINPELSSEGKLSISNKNIKTNS
jgi:hypothetical protein